MSAERHGIIVTGASSGIGRAIAVLAAQRGYAVLAIARRADRLAELAAELGDGSTFATLACDVTAADAPARIAAAARSALPRIDILLHNAGAARAGTLLEQNDAAIREQWDLHLAAPLQITRALLANLRATRGTIAMMGSGLAVMPVPGFGAYCAAKAAVRAACTQLRRELRADGIAVCYCDPGVVATEFSAVSGTAAPGGMRRADPRQVARRLLDGIEQRRSRIDANRMQPWLLGLARAFPGLADAAIARIVSRAHADAPEAEQPRTDAATPEPTPETAPPSALEDALAPLARRMERVKLPIAFLASLLVLGSEIDINEAAMRWAGMPNKNERALLGEAFDALVAAGYLERIDPQRLRVLRGAEPLERNGDKKQ
uniref:Putative Serine 3-dehydrogenase n=1 Tax=mine drainage metagenome TaxID=410659 RepID=E6Q3E4_9ZZZZ